MKTFIEIFSADEAQTALGRKKRKQTMVEEVNNEVDDREFYPFGGVLEHYDIWREEQID